VATAGVLSNEVTFEDTVEFVEGVGSVKITFVVVATGVVSFSRILDEEFDN
jgi:hypothetical protein